ALAVDAVHVNAKAAVRTPHTSFLFCVVFCWLPGRIDCLRLRGFKESFKVHSFLLIFYGSSRGTELCQLNPGVPVSGPQQEFFFLGQRHWRWRITGGMAFILWGCIFPANRARLSQLWTRGGCG